MDIATDMDALRQQPSTEIEEIIDLVKTIIIKWETYQASHNASSPEKKSIQRLVEFLNSMDEATAGCCDDETVILFLNLSYLLQDRKKNL